jgi:hypothetical protein
MNEEEFATKDTLQKWQHITQVMNYIIDMDKMVEIRMRYNTNHPEKQRKEEQRNMRIDQYQRWAHIKNLYATHRDELSNTLDNEKFAEFKSILERIFTMEVDDALREIVEE